MTGATANPFDSLYVTETIDSKEFVKVFSPLLVHDTSALFRQGNIILLGTQGSGKSMLLSLLKPETVVAFDREKQEFPVDEVANPFIGTGINLLRSGAMDFGQRPLPNPGGGAGVVEAYFGDFLNYWISRDLLKSVQILSGTSSFRAAAEIDCQCDILDYFAHEVAKSGVWGGALDDVSTMRQLEVALTERLKEYRDFFNFNSGQLSDLIVRTKTSPGEPIATVAECLRTCGVISANTEIFVRIDQYESLEQLEQWQGLNSGTLSAVIHKMLGLRDPRVSYRIGTRRHAWPELPRMHGTTAVLEELRNFKIVDLDAILRGREKYSASFRDFADDVFRRRLEVAGFVPPNSKVRATTLVFGKSLRPEDEVRFYVKEARRRTDAGNSDYPYSSSQQLLSDLSRRAPLEARLGEAWIAQKSDRDLNLAAIPRVAADFDRKVLPWGSVESQYWRKERVAQALMQIAAKSRQRMIWAGEEDIFALSGGNILVFVGLCQQIWDAWMRSRPTMQSGGSLPSISNTYVHDEGIQQASEHWFRKIRTDPDGDSRQRFVRFIGEEFRSWLREDSRMSYPGHNGFSLDPNELEADGEVKRFLQTAASFGVLVDRNHVGRSKGDGKRIKWYLSPIYCPYFQIPVSHVKEPKYVSVQTVREWLIEADILPGVTTRAASRPDQPSLFDV